MQLKQPGNSTQSLKQIQLSMEVKWPKVKFSMSAVEGKYALIVWYGFCRTNSSHGCCDHTLQPFTVLTPEWFSYSVTIFSPSRELWSHWMWKFHPWPSIGTKFFMLHCSISFSRPAPACQGDNRDRGQAWWEQNLPPSLCPAKTFRQTGGNSTKQSLPTYLLFLIWSDKSEIRTQRTLIVRWAGLFRWEQYKTESLPSGDLNQCLARCMLHQKQWWEGLHSG